MSNIWELEAEVRRMLQSGVDFGGSILAVAGLDDAVRWAKLQGGMLEVIYIKGSARVTVHAAVGGGRAAVMSAALDGMPCGGPHD
jgi:hypothetical protein